MFRAYLKKLLYRLTATRRCSAFVESEQCQCKRRAIPTDRYCWQHYPKKSLLLVIAGALVAWAFRFGGEHWIPSREQEQLADLDARLTGGNSFCFMLASVNDDKKMQFYIQHAGQNQLRNVAVNISDEVSLWSFAKMVEALNRANQYIKHPDYPKNVPRIKIEHPQVARLDIQEVLPHANNKIDTNGFFVKGIVFRYVISFSSSNGKWIQRIGGNLVGGKWIIGSYVTLRNGRPQLLIADREFPRDAEGLPDLTYYVDDKGRATYFAFPGWHKLKP